MQVGEKMCQQTRQLSVAEPEEYWVGVAGQEVGREH